MLARDFLYKNADIEATAPCLLPDPDLLNLWRDEFFSTTDVSGYDLWLCGAAMEPFFTRDIDIIITGEIDCYQRLEKILFNAKNIGFKYRQFLDISWNDYYKKFLMKGRCQRRAICCEHYYEHDWCTVEDCARPAENVKAIVYGGKVLQINGGESRLEEVGEDSNWIAGNLWEISIDSPSKKQIKRILEGRIYNHSPVIITKDFDFRYFVDWGDLYFENYKNN